MCGLAHIYQTRNIDHSPAAAIKTLSIINLCMCRQNYSVNHFTLFLLAKKGKEFYLAICNMKSRFTDFVCYASCFETIYSPAAVIVVSLLSVEILGQLTNHLK